MLLQRSTRYGLACTSSKRPTPLRLAPFRSLLEPRPSVDPLANKPRAAYASPGSVYTILTAAELEATLAEHKDRLVVLMCKSSHCKPCKAFMPKYNKLAEKLADSVLLDLTGDHSVETKKMMIEWGVKSTPTFRIYRGGEVVGTATGAKEAKLLPVLAELLREGERGRDTQPADLVEPDSDSDEDSD